MDADLPAASMVPWRLHAACAFLRQAFSHCSRGLLVVVVLLGLTRSVVIIAALWIQGQDLPMWVLFLRPLMGEITAACMLVAILIAEQWVRSGMRRLPAYAIAVVAGAVVAGFACSALAGYCLLGNSCLGSIPPQAPLHEVLVQTWLYNSGDALSRGGLAAYIYSYREQMLGSMRALHAAEVERAQTEQRINEVRLRALQAQVDPQGLLDTLGQVETLYEIHPARADRLLATLIRELRAASVRAAA